MVHLARAVKDAQVEEKCCYNCGSLEHFIRDCPLVRAHKPPGGGPQGVGRCTQTPFLNPDPFQHWYRVKNVAKLKINGENCMALLDNGTQINTIIPSYVKSHSLEMGLITDLIGGRVTCVGLGNACTQPLGYIIVKVQLDGARVIMKTK